MKYNLEILTIIVILVFGSVFVLQNARIQGSLQPGEVPWSGADTNAAKIIESSGYSPWFSSVWKPPSHEIETLFFCLQAAAGALVIGYIFGYNKGKTSKDE